jgi:hypothetical protein
VEVVATQHKDVPPAPTSILATPLSKASARLELLPSPLAPLPILQKTQVLPQRLPELLTSSKKRHEPTGYAALPSS